MLELYISRIKLQQRSQDQGEPADDAGFRLWSIEGDDNSQQIQDDCPERRHEPPRGRNILAEVSGRTLHKDLEENRVCTHLPINGYANGYQKLVWRWFC